MWYFIVAAIIAVGDQLFKSWIIANIELGGQIDVIPGIIHLTYVRNTGAAFSMLSDMRWPLIIISLVAIVAIIFVLIKKKFAFWINGSLCLVLGGAVGNLIDRVFRAFVVDMFEVEFTTYAVFNFADCCIVVGGIVFCIAYFIVSTKAEKEKKNALPQTGENTGEKNS